MRERHTRSEKKEEKKRKGKPVLMTVVVVPSSLGRKQSKKVFLGGQAPCEWAIKHEGEDGEAKCQEEARRGC